ncbi:MAG: hypothetical protein IJQ17_02580, partial [Oscillospiraceae bacterium]|nr:hypothetical protein [Oscillospiraceae bacterium]
SDTALVAAAAFQTLQAMKRGPLPCHSLASSAAGGASAVGPAKNERLVEPVPLGYMSSLFSDFMGSRLRARNLRCFFDNLSTPGG